MAATFQSIMRDLKDRNFAPVYYLMGDEGYYIDKICDWIAENVLQPEERDFNQTILF
jgi:DNA polymerase-3 subunit delta